MTYRYKIMILLTNKVKINVFTLKRKKEKEKYCNHYLAGCAIFHFYPAVKEQQYNAF